MRTRIVKQRAINSVYALESEIEEHALHLVHPLSGHTYLQTTYSVITVWHEC